MSIKQIFMTKAVLAVLVYFGLASLLSSLVFVIGYFATSWRVDGTYRIIEDILNGSVFWVQIIMFSLAPSVQITPVLLNKHGINLKKVELSPVILSFCACVALMLPLLRSGANISFVYK